MKETETYQLKWIRALDDSQLKLVLLLQGLANEENIVTGYSVSVIAELMNANLARVFRTIKPLIEAGIVEVSRKGKGAPNTYKLNLDKI